jgi:hypothetical protein
MRWLVLVALILTMLPQVNVSGERSEALTTTVYYTGLLEVSESGGYLPEALIREGVSSLYLRVTYVVKVDLKIWVAQGMLVYTAIVDRRIDSISSSPAGYLANATMLEDNFTYTSINIFSPPIVLLYTGDFNWSGIDWTGYKENIVLFDVDLIHVGYKRVESIENTNYMLIKDLYYDPVARLPLFYSYMESRQSTNGSLMVRISLNGLYSSLNLTGIIDRSIVTLTTENESTALIRVAKFKNSGFTLLQVNDTCIKLVFGNITPVFISVETPTWVKFQSNVVFTRLPDSISSYYIYEGFAPGELIINFNTSIDMVNKSSITPIQWGLGYSMTVNLGDVIFALFLLSILAYATYVFARKIAAIV